MNWKFWQRKAPQPATLTEMQQRNLWWAEALESGQYRQGTGSLHTVFNEGTEDETHRYCCLGVACEVAMEHGVWLKRTKRDDHTVQYNHQAGLPPREVANWFGWDCEDPLLHGPISASALNDQRSWGFSQIANAIRVHYVN